MRGEFFRFRVGSVYACRIGARHGVLDWANIREARVSRWGHPEGFESAECASPQVFQD